MELTRRNLTKAGLLLGILPAATRALAADKPPIKIGANMPLSGFQRPNGEMYRAAVEMAIEEVNAAGGVNGSPIQLIIDDDQGLANETVLLFRRHVADGIAAHLGPISGTTFESVAPLANAMRVPTINFTALKPGIARKPYALKLHPSDDVMIPEGVTEFLAKFPNLRNVVITGDAREASGAAGMTEFAKVARAKNLTVADTVSFDTRTTDYSPVAIKIKGASPDAVFVSSFGPNSLALLKELDVQGLRVPVLVNALIWAANFVQTVTAGADRVYTIGFNTNDPAPGVAGHDDFTRRYIERAERTTSLPKPINVSNATMGYDTIMLLAGIMKEKGLDGTTAVPQMRQAITDGLAAVKTWSGLNSITMQDNGDGYIKSRLLEVDVANKLWRYSSAPR
ncbi:ABC transporter substrate-binding protein [Roseomonas sp. BN140053]|uniref:ABC transporter substrate-binding protein n=1 Tax=Roseomonas sp. BN140053 TaxID=3391898 RepID=UPI0039EB859C